MRGVLLLAWRQMAFQKVKTAILVACVTLTVYLPVALHLLVDRFQVDIMSRAVATPLVVGAKGSRFDLVLQALYFETKSSRTIPQRETARIRDSGYASAIPLHIRYQARGFPIVGTTIDYFRFRHAQLLAGRELTRLGDCVVGAEVARHLSLRPDDRLMSDPENVFDLGGNYPLNMRVVGILAPNHTADDRAVFVDIKTAWIIAGLGHGHQDITQTHDPAVTLERNAQEVVANAALPQYTEITDNNIGSFHFHGDQSDFPLSAIIAVPQDEKSQVLLTAQYDGDALDAQILVPSQVMREMMDMIFRVRRFFDVNAIFVGIATVLLYALVVLLSLRLRQRELETLFKIGCSRSTIVKMQALEIAATVGMGLTFVVLLSWVTIQFGPAIMRSFVF